MPPPRRKKPRVRTGQLDVELTRDEFGRRFAREFDDPRFDAAAKHVRALADIAWRNHEEGRKAPRTVRAGPAFADPGYELSADWLAARHALQEAQRLHDLPTGPARVLIINGSPRNDRTCPGEMSKTWRLARIAGDVLDGTPGIATEMLDLSRLTAEYGRVIFPCKACVSTAMPLCHWPCSCYPNHGNAQVRDWMHEIYPMWVAAHGILIVTPVHWYQAPSVLKLMMDRLVCADGGNPDPTTTSGKDASKAKEIELCGWSYPRHLAGRLFALIVHADAAGADGLRRMLHDWLTDMQLVSAGAHTALDRYVGYYEPYATSHDALDRDHALREEVRNVAAGLARAVMEARRRGGPPPAPPDPRPK